MWWSHAGVVGPCATAAERGWIRARVLSIHGSLCVASGFEMGALSARLTDSPALIVQHFSFPIFAILGMVLCIIASHTLIGLFAIIVATETLAVAASTAARSLVMSCQSIASGKAAATFWTGMRPLARVKFGVALQVVQSSEARLTVLTDIRFLLAMGEKMALEIVVARKISRTIRTLVSFCRR